MKYTIPLHFFFHYTCIWKKISVGGLYTSLFCAINPYLVSLLFAVLVSLHPVTFSNVFYYLFYILATLAITVRYLDCIFQSLLGIQLFLHGHNYVKLMSWNLNSFASSRVFNLPYLSTTSFLVLEKVLPTPRRTARE